MGQILYQPEDMTWEEWMCELMCGAPEEEQEEEENNETVQ